MKKSIILSLLLAVSIQVFSQNISSDDVKKHLYTLADDNMEGRKAGTPGIEKAAQYIEGEFDKIGLTFFDGATAYRQNFKKKGLDLFNVIGVLEGKSKKDEFVIISAHYDHLGIEKGLEGDSIYNGANDDASGVAAVLALAKYFKEKGGNERSIIFAAFTAEELGLIGSNYFGTTVNADKIMAGINIEMIGVESSFGPKTAWLSGFNRSDFGKMVQKNVEGTGYTIHPDPYYPKFNLFFRSDNAALALLGVPAHTFSTSPPDDKNYHKVSDEAETLNIENITETIRVIAIGTASFIDGTDTPTRVQLTDKEKSKLLNKFNR